MHHSLVAIHNADGWQTANGKWQREANRGFTRMNADLHGYSILFLSGSDSRSSATKKLQRSWLLGALAPSRRAFCYLAFAIRYPVHCGVPEEKTHAQVCDRRLLSCRHRGIR